MKILISESDIRASMDLVISHLAISSAEHAREIGTYMRRAFKPNPQLVPIGVAIMYSTGLVDFQKMMTGVYPPTIEYMVSHMLLDELRKLPGVDEIFKQFNSK